MTQANDMSLSLFFFYLHCRTTLRHTFSTQSEMPQIDIMQSDTDCDQDLITV